MSQDWLNSGSTVIDNPKPLPDGSVVFNLPPSAADVAKEERERRRLKLAERADARAEAIANAPEKKLTPAQKAVDSKFATSYVEWAVDGGRADFEKGRTQISEVLSQLRAPGADLTGPVTGRTPDFIRSFTNPQSIATRDAVEEVVQRNLRLVLGAQFTAAEGERLIARAYNPTLGETENAKRVGRLLKQMEQAAASKDAAAAYYEENGTLAGWDGRLPTMSDLEASIDDPLLDADTGGAGLATTPVTEEESAAAFGEPLFDADGNPVGPDYQGDYYDRDGKFLSLQVRVGDDSPVQDPRDEMGLLDSLGETITGNERSTPEIEALPDWSTMPAPGLSGLLASLGTMVSSAEETAQILRAQGIATSVRQDAKGNFILTGQDGKEYAIKPGLRASDIPRAAGAVMAFTPAGRAATLPGSFAAGAGTQAVIEGVEASAGGNFDANNVTMAGAGNAGGVLLQRGISAGVNRFGRPSQSAPNANPATAAPEPMPQATVATAAPDAPLVDLDAAAGGNLSRPVASEQATEFGEVAKAALGRGKPAREAKEKLAIAAQANPEARAAADRLGIELPIDVIADDARLLTAQGLARSQISSPAQSEWGAAVRSAIDKSDATLAEIGASRDLAQLSDDVRVRLQGDMDALETAGDALRADVNAAIDVRAPVDATALQSALGRRIEDLGGIDEAKQAFSAEEKKLLAMLGEGEVAKRPTYARLDQIRDDIGKALFKKQGPWVDTNEAALKKYYGALAEDRVAHVDAIGGEDLANKLRASNDTFVKMYGVRNTMQTVFGKTLEKDIGTLVTRSIGNASKGDAKDLRTLLTAVPKDMQARTVLSGLMAKADRPSAGGGFSFNEYAKLYRGMRQNAPIYAEIAKTVGPQATQILQDLYVISSRMAAAEAKIVRTGASNQPILNALRSEGLVAKTLEAGKRVGARGAGAVVGGTTGGPVGAAVGQEISGALVDALTKGTRSIDQLHALLSSDAFRDLTVKAAEGVGETKAINRLASDPRFVRFGKSIGLTDQQSRRNWIVDALGGSSAPVSNVVSLPAQGSMRVGASPLPLAAEDQNIRGDRTTTREVPR